MKFTTGPLFTTLAFIAYLPGILAVARPTANQGSVAVLSYGLANNGTAVGNGAEVVNPNQGEDNKDDAGNDAEDNDDENNNENEEEDTNDQQNDDEENKNQDNEKDNQNNDQDLEENDIKGNLQQNIGNLMLSLGVCNFDIGSISGIGVGSQIQLLLQLQQLAQLQQLGLVNSFSIEQLIRQEILLNNFNLKIIKRTVSASVKQASRENKRAIVARKQCQNKNNDN
ncbi:hypothetical protein F5Y00DRAFT_262132 [Daldinia vernicosa]|uniref:uncharacterized protein n=1 Tax=Daldinia vernicosa TaxID=114800 RepID=UPI0020082E0A|nr:uncharacterized protein F5Y00DRAFT_262132 [Daldinia vernicosa]KAI0848974.1 hypothetical protein F5Y00DRAFT_262132 [Daldinia vernicosa]